jgi:hypothetical protein
MTTRSFVLMGIVFLVATAFGDAVLFGADQRVGGFSLPLPPNILGSSWVGDVTYVDTGGRTRTVNGVVVSFLTQTGEFFSGTFSDPSAEPNEIAFSGVTGPFSNNLLISAEGYVIHGDIMQLSRPHRLVFRGNNTTNGATFFGVLARQEP